ncbi:hypothetical protein HPB48_010919 [Haemaphysalis longicornis]|uniref:Uncharacterized protein n=1 Tax=Haemaphysalis longicornis TaxID=44386 RepID=A0A9J6H6M6_HAELO|nr:hypothetical protein HPB48_010919 [Haemaphysalis longicornis]
MRAALEREFRKENREIKASLDFFNKQFEDQTKHCSQLEKENLELKVQNASLAQDCAQLKKDAAESEQRQTQLEQYSRNRNIEVKNVPFVKGENLAETLEKLGEAISEPITPCDVDGCHRVPSKDSTCPHIIVQFHSRSKRDTVLEKARKMRLSANDFGFTETTPEITPIYVNEHLCPQLKKLWV